MIPTVSQSQILVATNNYHSLGHAIVQLIMLHKGRVSSAQVSTTKNLLGNATNYDWYVTSQVPRTAYL